MEELRQENKKLKELHASCEDELEKLKETGKAHEAEIDTLLKFNERLLGIIENEFNSATKSKISSDLQIITETNEASTDLNNHPQFRNRFAGQPPKMGGNYEQQDLEGFDEEEEEEIYNHERPQSHPPPSASQNQEEISPTKKTARLDRVFEQQQKGIEESINLSNSIQHSNPSSYQQNERYREKADKSSEIQELREMIKEYKEEFVENSAEYEQICLIIRNDLLKDLEEFKKLREHNAQFYQEKVTALNNLRHEIKRFRPVSELVRVMKRLNVPPATERLLQQQIVSKHG
jgi:hypothetical protein